MSALNGSAIFLLPKEVIREPRGTVADVNGSAAGFRFFLPGDTTT